jgi:predicted nucleic-acid-binding Zn-ribbon protein
MGFLKGLVHAYVRRTCLKCGTSWTMPRSETRRHFSGGSTAPLSGMLGPRGAALIIQSDDRIGNAPTGDHNNAVASAETRARDAVCPKCGSDTWTQKRAWSGSSNNSL